MFKFITLLNLTTPKILKNLAHFILKAELRQTRLNANQGNGRPKMLLYVIHSQHRNTPFCFLCCIYVAVYA